MSKRWVGFFTEVSDAKIAHICRPRLIRIITSTNWSIHDLILVDCEYSCVQPCAVAILSVAIAPEFHLVIQEGSNGEVYNMAIRGELAENSMPDMI